MLRHGPSVCIILAFTLISSADSEKSTASEDGALLINELFTKPSAVTEAVIAAVIAAVNRI